MRIYISGAMASCSLTYKRKFNEMAKKVNANGDIAVNPAVLPNGLDHDRYMPMCLTMIDASDAILMLKDWTTSEGAKLEKAYAEYQGKTVLYEKEYRLWQEDIQKQVNGQPKTVC